MTLAILGFGVQFQIGDGGSPEAFTTLDELVDASPPGVSRAPVDGTHMGAEARFMLFLSGLRDGGEIPLVFHYSAETYEVLIGEYLIDAVRRYRVVGPDGYYWEFDGFVTQLEAPPPIDDVWEINVTIKVSGKPLYDQVPPPPPPPLPYNLNIVLLFHQSGSEDAAAVPILDVVGEDGALMWGTNRPRFYSAPFASSLSNAVSAEYIDATEPAANHWGGDKAMSLGKTIIAGVNEYTGQTPDEHGYNVLVVYAGMSSSWITDIGTGSATRLKVKALLAEIRDYALANELTAGIVAQCHHGGEEAYVLGLTTGQVITDLTNFYGPGGDIQTDLYTLFGQAEVGTTYCITSHAHDPRGYDIDPRVAEAEVQLAEAQSWFKVVKGSGDLIYAGLRWGTVSSSVHPGNFSQALFGKAYGDAIVTDQIEGETLFEPIPTFSRASTTQIRATFANWPAGGFGTVIGTGLFPSEMQPNYGWFFCDPATPTVELAMSNGSPYWDGEEIVFNFASVLPTNVTVRHGARTSSVSLAGNMCIDVGETYTIDGVTYESVISIPALNRSVP